MEGGGVFYKCNKCPCNICNDSHLHQPLIMLKKAKIIIRGEKSNLHLPVTVQIMLTSQSKNCVYFNSLNHPSRRCLHFLENNIHLFKLPCTIIWQWRELYLSSERIYKVTLYEHLFAPVVQTSSDLSFTLATIIDATVLW